MIAKDIEEIINFCASQDMIIEGLEDHIKDIKSVNDLFDIAVKKGLVELVEYLYIWHNIEYELDEIMDRIKPSIFSDNKEFSNAVVNDISAKDSLKIEYFSKNESTRLKSIHRLLELKKYSNMRYSNKKFFYKFNPKYRSNFLD